MKTNYPGRALSWLLISTSLFVACNKISDDQPIAAVETQSSGVRVQLATGLGTARLNANDAGVVNLQTAARNTPATVIANPYLINQLASIQLPAANALANDVHVVGNTVYVAYRDKDGNYSGSIDAIDVSNPAAPIIQSTVNFPNTDVHAVFADGNRLYWSGSTHPRDVPAGRTASFGYLNLNGTGGFASTGNSFHVPGDIAYDVSVDAAAAYVATGMNRYLLAQNNGSHLIQANKNNGQIISNINVNDARAVQRLAGGAAILSLYSGTGVVQRYNVSGATPQAVTNRAIAPDPQLYQRRGFARTANSELLVANGRGGTLVMDDFGGQTFGQIMVPNSWPYGNPDSLASFDVAYQAGANRILAANGLAGLYVALLNGTQVQVAGALKLGNVRVHSVDASNTIVAIATNTGVRLFSVAATTQTSGACSNLSQYPTEDPDLEVFRGRNLGYAGPVGLQTLHVGGTYLHCGNLSVSKNLTDSAGATITVTGNLSQGYTNSTYYMSLEPGSRLNIGGNLVVFGDLVLESGSTLHFTNGGSITVYGHILRQAGSVILGNPTVIRGDTTASTSARINTAGATLNQPNSAHGILVYPSLISPQPIGEYLEFAPIFPRNMNNMRRYNVRVNGVTHFNIDVSDSYMGRPLTYKLPNGNVVTRTIPVINQFSNFNIDF